MNLATGPGGEVRPCVTCALYLVVEGELRAAVLFRSGQRDMGQPETTLEITATDPAFAARIAADVRRLAVEHNVYRGQVVSFDHDVFGERETVLSFHARPDMTADELILPRETSAAITRQVVGVARHRARLLAARQHLKRGLLLYGPPGVGKTHTVRYLISQLTETTIVELSGSSMHMIGGLLGGPDPATGHDRGRGCRSHRRGTRHAPRTASPAVPAPQRDGRAGRGRRRGLPARQPTAPICSNRRSRRGPAGWIRQWHSTIRTSTRAADCSASTEAALTSTRADWLGAGADGGRHGVLPQGAAAPGRRGGCRSRSPWIRGHPHRHR